MNNPDPLASIIASMIHGVVREHGDDGPWLLLKAEACNDGRVIAVDVIRYDLTTAPEDHPPRLPGEHTKRLLMHLSPPMPVDAEPCPASKNGAVDPVIIATPDGSTA